VHPFAFGGGGHFDRDREHVWAEVQEITGIPAVPGAFAGRLYARAVTVVNFSPKMVQRS
jgi:hypothetical protein